MSIFWILCVYQSIHQHEIVIVSKFQKPKISLVFICVAVAFLVLEIILPTL